jgi:hypothetical protein
MSKTKVSSLSAGGSIADLAIEGRMAATLPPREVPPVLDVVVKTRWQDVQMYLRLQRDLIKHCQLGGKVYVIAARRHLRRLRRMVTGSFVLLASEEVIEASGYQAVLPETWVTQQILKLLAGSVVESSHYLLLDSNTLLGFDFDEKFFRRKSRSVYGIGDFSDMAWELQSRNLLRITDNTQLQGFRAVNQIFIRRNVQALLRYLEKLYGDDAVTTLMRLSDHRNALNWTEFVLYGIFCHHLLADSLHHFEVRRDLLSFSFRSEFEMFLDQVKTVRPLMIKFYKRRPTYHLSDTAYRKYVSQIKRSYLA